MWELLAPGRLEGLSLNTWRVETRETEISCPLPPKRPTYWSAAIQFINASGICSRVTRRSLLINGSFAAHAGHFQPQDKTTTFRDMLSKDRGEGGHEQNSHDVGEVLLVPLHAPRDMSGGRKS